MLISLALIIAVAGYGVPPWTLWLLCVTLFPDIIAIRTIRGDEE